MMQIHRQDIWAGAGQDRRFSALRGARLCGLALLLGSVASCSDTSSADPDHHPDLFRLDGAWLDGGPGEAGADSALSPDGPAPWCRSIDALVAAVDPARLYDDLAALTGLEERRTQAGQRAAAEVVRARLLAIPGLSLREHRYSYSDLEYVNLEGSVAGSAPGGQVLMAGAHYDSTSRDSDQAPGADDNASGVAAVLEAARLLSACRPRVSLRFVLFSNEELGAVGAAAYVQELQASLPAEQVLGVLNADMVGYTQRPDEDLDLATRPAYAELAHRSRAAMEAHTSLPIKEVINDQCG